MALIGEIVSWSVARWAHKHQIARPVLLVHRVSQLNPRQLGGGKRLARRLERSRPERPALTGIDTGTRKPHEPLDARPSGPFHPARQESERLEGKIRWDALILSDPAPDPRREEHRVHPCERHLGIEDNRKVSSRREPWRDPIGGQAAHQG